MLPPSLPPITDTDLEILDALRLERFRSRFGQILAHANLYISGLDRTLIISGEQTVGALRYRTLDLKEQSWQVCGSTWVKVYASNELILSFESSYNKLEDCIRGESMATAIQEQDLAIDNGTTEVMELTPTSTSKRIIRSLSLADIAADLEAEETDLQTFLEEQNATLFEFDGTIVVPETEAVFAYEHYSLVRARQKMQERFTALKKTQHEEKINKRQEPKDKPKKNYLTWKGAFKVNRSSYKKTIESALNALFPNEPDEQQKALTEIVNQTEMGKAILDKIARDSAYPDKAKARENLLKAATELVIPTEASDEEKDVEAAV